MPEWPELLREAREATGLSRRALAELSGVGENTIVSYELTRRRPRLETLFSLMQAMKLDGAATNAILTDAGFEAVPAPWALTTGLQTGGLHRNLADLPAELATYSWPCLALNERFEIIAWNAPAVKVAEMDFATALPEPYQRNLLRIAAMQHYRQRVKNWDVVVGMIVGMYKNHHMGNEDLAEGSPYFQAVVNDILQHDSGIMNRLMTLWLATPPRPQSFRHTFPVVWEVADGTLLAFNCILSNWSEYDGVGVRDWHPADAVTWEWLNKSLNSEPFLESLRPSMSDTADESPRSLGISFDSCTAVQMNRLTARFGFGESAAATALQPR